jgi:hypothetical protein
MRMAELYRTPEAVMRETAVPPRFDEAGVHATAA